MTLLKTRALTRQQIGQFVDSERGIRAFEDVQADIINQYEAISSASFLTISTEPSLGSERVFTPSGDFAVVDGGPNTTYSLSLSDTGIAAGIYGDASHTLGITVSATGRVSAISSYLLVTDNVTEGSTNLYFTIARARGSVSGGLGISYDSIAGTIALDTASTRNTDHASVTLTAGAGLTGGGDITASRTFDIGAGTGITVNANDIAIATNGVTDTLLRQSSGLSLVGRTANSTGNVADITAASDGQVMRRAGTSIAFGAIDLSSANAVTNALAAANGGTGQSSYTAGDLLYASGASAISKLAIGSNGYVLTSNGSAPGWTANTGTGNVVRATQPQFTNTIGVGTAASASGSGVSFPATQSPSTDKNTLDDYEEDVWTPTVTSGSGSLTSYTASGYYTKVGRHVHATIVISITNNGTGAGSIAATLPFTAASGPLWVGSGRENASTGNMLQGILASGGSAVTILAYNNTYPGGTGAQLVLTISYFI